MAMTVIGKRMIPAGMMLAERSSVSLPPLPPFWMYCRRSPASGYILLHDYLAMSCGVPAIERLS